MEDFFHIRPPFTGRPCGYRILHGFHNGPPLPCLRISGHHRHIAGEILHNYGTLRQLDVVVGVAYDTDIALALQTIRDLLATHPTILQQPEPVIRVLTLSDFRVQIAICPWVGVGDFIDASSDITQAVLETFRAHGIVIPLPQREVRLLDSARLDSARLGAA